MRRALLALALLPLPSRAAEVPSIPAEEAVAPLSEPAVAPTAAPALSPPVAVAQTATAAPIQLPAPIAPAAAAAPAATETVEQMVQRLMRRPREETETLAASFDGAKLRAEAFPDSDAVGAVRQTRHGQFILASSEVKRDDRGSILLERWSGPHGGVWLARRRGPEAYEIKEWHGALPPSAFGGTFLPQAAYSEVWLTNGIVSSSVSTARDRGHRASTLIHAKKEFRDALAWFGTRVTGIQGSWSYGSNLAEFNRLLAAGKSPEEAALGTWTGQRAAEAGLTRVVFDDEDRAQLSRSRLTPLERISVRFLKP